MTADQRSDFSKSARPLLPQRFGFFEPLRLVNRMQHVARRSNLGPTKSEIGENDLEASMFPYTPSIEARALHEAAESGLPIKLIDVRSTQEYAYGHAAGAISMPLDSIEPDHIASTFGKGAGTTDPVYLICTSGIRAEQAARKLEHLGLHNLVLVDGGTQSWQSNGLPMQRTSRMPSLESQVQIAVGVLLLVILAKAMLLHPVFYVLLGVVGAALIAVGLTARYCLTALMSRMPWNRAPAADLSASG